jgi:hypothetical protein
LCGGIRSDYDDQAFSRKLAPTNGRFSHMSGTNRPSSGERERRAESDGDDECPPRDYNPRRMLMHRLKAAVLCLLLTSGAILGTMPSCGRGVTQAAVCCKNEATCPMHQKHAAFGFNVCHGESVTGSAVTTSHRAVLATPIQIANAPQRDHVFPMATILLPTVFILPGTPPPRLG